MAEDIVRSGRCPTRWTVNGNQCPMLGSGMHECTLMVHGQELPHQCEGCGQRANLLQVLNFIGPDPDYQDPGIPEQRNKTADYRAAVAGLLAVAVGCLLLIVALLVGILTQVA